MTDTPWVDGPSSLRYICRDHDCPDHALRDPACTHMACTLAPYADWMDT